MKKLPRKRKEVGVKDILRFVPPRLNPFVLRLVGTIAPLYVKKVLGLQIGPPLHEERIAEEYRRFFNGENRLIIVFRHVHVNDAQVLFYVLHNLVRKNARSHGITLKKHPHAHFLYGRGVPVWGGKGLEYLFSRLGGIPVHHRKLDRQGLDVVRRYMLQGEYPIALAPEGQVTYHNEIVYELEPGFAQLALWAKQDKDVRILPISQYYNYVHNNKKNETLLKLIYEIQEETGIKIVTSRSLPERIQPLLSTLGAALFSKIEYFYRHYYGLKFSSKEGECSRRRVEGLVDQILKMQEGRLGIVHPPRGFTPRIYIVRLTGWNRIFVHDREADPKILPKEPPLDDSLHNFIAREAELFSLHLEVVDVLAYMHPEYSLHSDDENRHVEFLLNLLDAVNRLKGGTIGQRKNPRPCRVEVQAGAPISLTELHTRNPECSARDIRSMLVDTVAIQFKEMASGTQREGTSKLSR